MVKFIFIIFIFTYNEALAAISIGTSLSFIKINDPIYKYTNEFDQIKPSSLNVGYSKEINNFNFGLFTNRLLNKGLSREVESNGMKYTNHTKTTLDIAQLGYRRGRLSPNVFISNSKIDKELFYKGSLAGQKINHLYLYGVGFNYYLDNKTLIGLTYIAPNNEINLKGGITIGINYIL